MSAQFPVKELQQYLKGELNDLAKSLGLDTYGTKAQLCARILGITPSARPPKLSELPKDILNRSDEDLYIAINCESLETSPVLGFYSSRESAVTQSYNYLKKKYSKDKKIEKLLANVTTPEGQESVLDELGIHISVQKLDQPMSGLKCPPRKKLDLNDTITKFESSSAQNIA